MLSGKVAIVTGAARGIGEAIARKFASKGAFVYVTDINDVRLEDDWGRVMSVVEREHSRLDILVNNAGITGFENGIVAHDPEHASLENWRDVHRTNLDGVFLGCKHAIAAMRRGGSGSIINISSRSGLVGVPAAAAYASSKAAVRNHTKSVALYCAQQGLDIRCNSVHPAAILTPMWEPMLGHGAEREQRMREFVRDTPLQRFGTVEEVAAVVMLLASGEAAYMTGTEIVIDGGILAGSAGAPRAADEPG
jgi:NAD(P)-dependent dehydrogenase (short-subunit alcohol dehydrogenase family)